MINQPTAQPTIAIRACDRRVILKAAASFAAMAALGGAATQRTGAQNEANAPETLAGTWVEDEHVGGFAAADDARVFQADFRFYAAAPHWSGSGPADALVELSFSSDGTTWSDPLFVGIAVEDAGPPDRDGRRFGRLVFVDGGASFIRYRSLDAAGNPIDLPGLAFTYLDASAGPRIDDVFSAALAPSINPPPVISRAAWGANERYRHVDQDVNKPLVWPPAYQTVEHVIIHHTATPNFQDPLIAIRSIYYYHAVTRGWGDIGYNYLVDYLGNVYEGRYGGENVIGGHAYQYARGSSGIGTLGSFQTVPPTAEAIAGLVWITAWVGRFLDPFGQKPFHEQANLPVIASHRDVLPTQCPGDSLYTGLGDIRAAVADVLTYLPDPDLNPTFRAGDTVRVVVAWATLRSGPGTNFTALRSIPFDSRFTVTDGPVTNTGYTWYKLTDDLGVGWMVDEVLEATDGGVPPEFVAGDGVRVNTDVLNLRAGPGLSATIIARLVFGERGTVLAGPNASDGYNWYRLLTAKGTGWSASAFLVKSDPPPGGFNVGATVTVNTDGLRLRSQPGLGGRILATMPFGTSLTVTQAPITVDGYTWYGVNSSRYGSGFCAGEFLAPTSGVSDTFPVGERVRVIGGALNLRSNPGLGASVVAVMPDGTVLTILGGPERSGGYTWYHVQSSRYGTGWCAGEFLAADSSAAESVGLTQGSQARVVDGALNLRAGPGLGRSVITVMANGTLVTILDGPQAADGYTWYRVTSTAYGTGWCAGEFLRPA